MSNFRPYPAYKDSGVEWLGRVPAHWRVLRFKLSTLSCQNGLWGDDPNGVDDIECVRVADFDRQALRVKAEVPTLRAITKRERVGRLLRRGDLVIEKSGGGEKQPVGQVVIYDRDGESICSNFLARIELAEGMDARFWNYQHHAAYVARINVRSIKQTSGIQNLDHQSYLDEVAAFPPSPEQTQIAERLDRETARIDGLVEKKTRFIALLREKRQALITHAVTKGLDPGVPMKDSGVEWLGQIPAEWSTKRLRFVCDVTTGGRDTAHAVEDGLYPFYVRSQEVARIDSYSADCEAVLTAGDGAGVGKVYHYATGKFDFHQRVYMMHNFRCVIGKFFFYFISSLFAAVALDGGAKSTVDSLRMPVFKNFRITIPPLIEQDKIVEFIESRTARIDTLIAKTERSIELLREHRTALITAAVTGKLDLREAA